ncbi:hypothetical protein UFOVP1106_32 [uncultured Caudovirales phage]|uniref:Uncharacterized protein n=1 Tax=uncultured Caudovirales phage TaxID=2100421 RepID=A0A6J5QFZ8_9CAUD|nr:hypothetical protein UFOVP1106_32 [uncultured Caudovirales phage]
MFKVGQKIVCVDSSNQTMSGYTPVIKDHIYTIRTFTPTQTILLVEIVNPPIHLADGFRESGYNQSRFRQIETQWVEELLERITEEVNIDETVELNCA